jgi:hypothetical protein
MVIKYIKMFKSQAFQNLADWFENIPFGNPGVDLPWRFLGGVFLLLLRQCFRVGSIVAQNEVRRKTS